MQTSSSGRAYPPEGRGTGRANCEVSTTMFDLSRRNTSVPSSRRIRTTQPMPRESVKWAKFFDRPSSSSYSPLEEDGFELAVPPRRERLWAATPGKHCRFGPEPVSGSAFRAAVSGWQRPEEPFAGARPIALLALEGRRWDGANRLGAPGDLGCAVALGAGNDGVAFAVGTSVTGCPPHRSGRAGFPHPAPTSGV
jgi:hypothetical protein